MGLRLQIALAMVLLAILGAITAYRGAVAEMESSLLEQKLDQGRLLELYFRQDRTDGALLRDTLDVRRQNDERMARQLMGDADKARAENDTDRALRLDLEAQEEAAAARALRQVSWILPDLNGDLSIEQNLRRGAVQHLNSLGFEASWAAPPKAEGEAAALGTATTDSVWPDLESEIATGHAQAPWLALFVAGFVATLVLLTIADILDNRHWKRGLLYAGSALGLLPAALSIKMDPEIVPWFAGAILAFAALVLLGWAVGALQGPKEEETSGHFHPAELERRGQGIAALVSHATHNLFTQCAVLGIAVAVLLSALVGYWFTTSDTHARQSALDAVGFETDMLKRGSLLGVNRAIILGGIAETLDQRARVASAAAGAATLPEPDQPGASTPQALRMHTAQYTGNALEWILDPDQGVVGDPDFPSHIMADLALHVDSEKPENGLHRNAWEAFAKWDAARTESVEAHHRAVLFLATLTVFAVAIYLLGQALGMSGGQAAIVLAGLGMAFVVVGTVGAVREELSKKGVRREAAIPEACALDPKDWGPIPGGSSALLAARQFGIGVSLLDTAYTTDGYDRAIDHLRCAVQLRPDLAEAKRRLAEAIFSARSSQMGESYMSLPGPDGLKEILEADESALEEVEKKGLSPARLRASIAFDGALAALADRDEFNLEKSVWEARKALEELPATNEAMTDARILRQFNFAVILLAAGNRDGALATYREALKARTFDTDFLLSAITDLQAVLALHCPDDGPAPDCPTLRQDVEALTADIVRAMAASSSDLQVAVTPGSVAADITTSSLAAHLKPATGGKSGRLVLLWYAIDPAWKAWHVLPDPSGPVAGSQAQTAGAELVIRRSLGDSWACMHGGRYRLEAYVDGARAGAVEIGLDDAGVAPIRFRDLNLILCAPAAWQRWSGTAETKNTRDVSEQPQDMLEGAMFPANDTRPVLYLRTVPGPRAGRDVTVDLEAAVRHLRGGTRVLKRVETREECLAGARPGTVLERAWRTSEGSAEVALGLVPDGDSGVSAAEICDTLVSVSTLYRPLVPPTP